jgi:hypothetical protein
MPLSMRFLQPKQIFLLWISIDIFYRHTAIESDSTISLYLRGNFTLSISATLKLDDAYFQSFTC